MTNELSKLIGALDRMCKACGPDTPLGSRYAMLSQQAQNYAKAETPQQKEALAKFMANTQAEIEQLKRQAGEG